MALEEVLLTRLEVNSKGELFAGFRDYGGIHFPNWKHLFVTNMLGRNSKQEYEQRDSQQSLDSLKSEIESTPELSGWTTRLKNKYWWIYQIFCPIRLKDKLPKKFIRGHYTPQARWRLSSPGHMITLDESITYALERQKQISQQVDQYKKRVSDDRSGAKLTRTINDLDVIFDEYNGENWQEVRKKINQSKLLVSLDSEVINARRGISDQIRISNSRMHQDYQITYSQKNKSKRDHSVRLECRLSEPDFLKRNIGVGENQKRNPHVRMPSGSELLDKKWLFFDIEIPLFRHKGKEQISWVGASYVEGDKRKKEIHTIHQFVPSGRDFKGCKIFTYENEQELVRGLTDRINTENPDFVSAYNAKFDLIKLRESEAGFAIGDEESNPLYRSTAKFFERIGVKDRFVIDPMRWAKIAKKFNPNSKLVMVAGFSKEISYDEMEGLEFKALDGDMDAAKKIASYLVGDVDELDGIFMMDDFRKDFGAACWLADKFNVGLERIMHSANCANEVQEFSFMRELGVYRDDVPPNFRTTKMQKKKTNAKGAFAKHIIDKALGIKPKRGLFENVYKAHIPVGEFFRNGLVRRFAEVKDFFEYMDEQRDDKSHLFFLEQFGDAFATWMKEDYGMYLQEVKKLDKLLDRVDNLGFEKTYHKFREEVVRGSEVDLRALDKAKISMRSLGRYFEGNVRDFAKNNGLSIERFRKLVNQRSEVKRRGRAILGNFDVYPSSRFFATEGRDKPVLDEDIINGFSTIESFIREEGLEVIAQEGNFLYLRGNREALAKPDAPIVVVDELERIYSADNVYYEKNGYTAHMKFADDPTFHLSRFEMNAYKKMLEHLFEGRDQEAIGIFHSELMRLKQGRVEIGDLLYYNKSKERYIAYDARSKKRGKGVYFTTVEDPNAGIEEQEKKLIIKHDPELGLDYYVAGRTFETRQKENNSGNDKTLGQDSNGQIRLFHEDEVEKERIYLAKNSDIIPNVRGYEKRFTKRARAILNHALNRQEAEKQLELI